MSKYLNDGISPVSFTADEDLTTYQYKTVAITASGGLTVERGTSGSIPMPIGILQNDPSAGCEAAVKVIGFTKAVARPCGGSWLMPGGFLVGASDGVLQPVALTNSTCAILARWMDEKQTTSDASYIGNVLLLGVAAPSGWAY